MDKNINNTNTKKINIKSCSSNKKTATIATNRNNKYDKHSNNNKNIKSNNNK